MSTKYLRNATKTAVAIGGLVVPVNAVVELSESQVRTIRRQYPERFFPEVSEEDAMLEETRYFSTSGETTGAILGIVPQGND